MKNKSLDQISAINVAKMKTVAYLNDMHYVQKKNIAFAEMLEEIEEEEEGIVIKDDEMQNLKEAIARWSAAHKKASDKMEATEAKLAHVEDRRNGTRIPDGEQ